MDPNTFPTKGNLILAKNSLALSRQGFDLMDKKRNILKMCIRDRTPADIYALLIPVHYRLTRKEISALVEAADETEFGRILDTTYYKKRFPALAPEKLEDFYNLNLKMILETEARKYPHSVITVSYTHLDVYKRQV